MNTKTEANPDSVAGQVDRQLGPLPEPRTLSRGDEDGPLQLGYTAEQMRAYAAQEVAAERKRCIGWCRKVMEHHQAQPDCSQEPDEPTFRDGEACGAEDCIEAIQHEGDWP